MNRANEIYQLTVMVPNPGVWPHVGVFFTRTLPRAIVRHLARHPLDPLPIVRARRALRQAGHDGADRYRLS
jgi:hypothetical protein